MAKSTRPTRSSRIEVKASTLKRVKSRRPPTEAELDQLASSSTDTGAIKPPSNIRGEISKASKSAAASVFSPENTKIPNWLKAHIEQKKSGVNTIEYLLTRVRKAPSTESLHLSMQLINDMLRKKDNQKVLEKILTNDTVLEFINLSNSK